MSNEKKSLQPQNFLPMQIGYEKMKCAFEASLKKPSLDYIDLYLIHFPQGDIHSSWASMEALCKEDKVRAIGVSNFNMDLIQDLLKRYGVVSVVNQVETHPFSQQ